MCVAYSSDLSCLLWFSYSTYSVLLEYSVEACCYGRVWFLSFCTCLHELPELYLMEYCGDFIYWQWRGAYLDLDGPVSLRRAVCTMWCLYTVCVMIKSGPIEHPS